MEIFTLNTSDYDNEVEKSTLEKSTTNRALLSLLSGPQHELLGT